MLADDSDPPPRPTIEDLRPAPGTGTERPWSNTDNPNGLHLRFHAANGEVFADFTPRAAHAGYPDMLHGGVIGAALDEAMFWAATRGAGRMHLSAEMTVRYRRKVQVGGRYRLVARMVRAARSMCSTEAELLDTDGEVCASASGKYLPLPDADAARVRDDFRVDNDTVPPPVFDPDS